MALINSKFHFTLTDDQASNPSIDQQINFTDNTGDTYTTTVKKIAPGASPSTDWKEDTETELMDLTTQAVRANYIIIQTDNPVYLFIGRTPARTADPVPLVDTAITPELRINRMMVISGPNSGSTYKIYAINPSREETDNLTATVTITYVYE